MIAADLDSDFVQSCSNSPLIRVGKNRQDVAYEAGSLTWTACAGRTATSEACGVFAARNLELEAYAACSLIRWGGCRRHGALDLASYLDCRHAEHLPTSKLAEPCTGYCRDSGSIVEQLQTFVHVSRIAVAVQGGGIP